MNYLNAGLFIVTFIAYFVSIVVKMSIFHVGNRQEDVNREVKMIPADLVLFTLSLNVGNLLNENSYICKLVKGDIRVIVTMILILISICFYLLLFSIGDKLHRQNQDFFFCQKKDLVKYLAISFVGVFFLFVTFFATAY